MASVKAFINKVKQKNSEYKAKQNEKKAMSKGFSSAQAYNFFSATAKSQGEEEGKSQLRKKELKRIKQEAKQEVILGRTGKYNKVQRKVQRGFETFEKGAGVYNEIMGGLQSLGSGNDSFYPTRNSNQAYASGYGAFEKPKRRRSSAKKSKPRKKSKQRQPRSFMDSFMSY